MADILWEPSEAQIENANMTRFMNFVNQEYSQGISTYEELYKWAIENIPDFWAAMWSFGEIVHSKTCGNGVDDLEKMPGASWFQGAKLNYAENLLRFRDHKTAIVFRGESRIVQKGSVEKIMMKLTKEFIAKK